MISKKGDVPDRDHYDLSASNTIGAHTCNWCGKRFLNSYGDYDPSDGRGVGTACDSCAANCSISGDRFLKRDMIYAPGAYIWARGRERIVHEFASMEYQDEFKVCPDCDRTIGLEQECECG